MLVLLIVIAAIVLLAVVLAFGGGFGGFGGYGEPTVRRRIYYRRRPVQRVFTEHRVVDEAPAPIDDPAYRR